MLILTLAAVLWSNLILAVLIVLFARQHRLNQVQLRFNNQLAQALQAQREYNNTLEEMLRLAGILEVDRRPHLTIVGREQME